MTMAGMQTFEFTIKLPQNVEITVSDEYHSPNYDIISETMTKKAIGKDNTSVDFQFDYKYNYNY